MRRGKGEEETTAATRYGKTWTTRSGNKAKKEREKERDRGKKNFSCGESLKIDRHFLYRYVILIR